MTDPRKPRALRYLLPAAALGALAATAYAVAPWLCTRQLLSQAKTNGLALTFGDYGLSYPELTLRSVSFSSLHGAGMKGTAEKVVVRLTGLKASAVHADTVQAQLAGSLRDALIPSAASSEPAPDVRVTRLSLQWGELSLRAGSFATSAEGARGAGHLRVRDQKLGNATMTWNRLEKSAAVALWFDGLPPTTESFPAPTLALEIHAAGDGLAAQGRLSKVQLQRLLWLFDERASPQDSEVEGRFELVAPPAGRGETKGHVTIDLLRFLPPHPPELRDLSFSQRTELKAEFTLSAEGAAELKPLTLQAGDLALSGSANVQPQGAGLRVVSQLAGQVQCRAVLEAARAPQSPLADRVATLQLSSVPPLPVSLDVAFNTADFNAVMARTTAGRGCGL